MADLDTFLDDQHDGVDFESDTGSVEQDTFNKTRFDAVKQKDESEIEPPVNSKPTADKLEKEMLQEQLEKTQAKELMSSVKTSPDKPLPTPYNKKASVEKNESPKPVLPVEKTPVIQKKPSMAVNKSSSTAAAQPIVKKPSANLNTSSKDSPFENKYSPEVVAFFTEINKKSFTQQAIEYLNAYWNEVGDQAEFIFSVAIKIFREADMHRQGVSLYYLYDEGSDVDYPTYLYFYEKLVKYVNQNPQWRAGQYEKSAVYEVKTAIKHKNDLKEKVDVNFDGRISFLEFLLYQYNTFSNPADYMQRAKAAAEEHPAVTAARQALDEVNARIRAYEQERARLEQGAAQPGVKGLTFKHQLTMLDKSSVSEELNKALITAEAAVRIAVKKFQGNAGITSVKAGAPMGALWWMQRDLDEKKRVAIPKTLRRVKKD